MWAKREGFSGTTIKDTWTNQEGVTSGEGGGDGWNGGELVGSKRRKLYSNNNKIIFKKTEICMDIAAILA